jgi:hypothetical protein
MRYYYTNDGGLCELFPIKTKEYTLEELYLVYDDMKSKYRLTKSKYHAAEEEVTAYVREHTLKDIQVDATEFHNLTSVQNDLRQSLTLCETALDGIRGAIRYYQAEALNKAYREVLPKYAGKQAGPKTREKFQNEVAQRLPGKARIYHNYLYTVSLYDDTLGLDSHFYANEDLYDTINRFNPEYQILTPSDSFSGHYPVDWVVWAVHVVEANKRIKEAFDKFYNESKSLSTSLCIGNTAMLSVSATDLKSR